MANIFSSSIGKKLMMAAAGLFLVSFLLVHLGINMLLVIFEDSKPFNLAAHFMGTNILIKVFEVVLFGGFILHILYGFIVQTINWISRPIGYKVANNQQTSYFSKFMIHTAVIIFIFMIIHLFDFYFKAKIFGEVPNVIYDGKEYHDLGALVLAKFKILWVVIFYIASFLFLGFHLLHGFQSAFQTLGIEHKAYTPMIKTVGKIITVIIVAGFTIIPVIIYFTR
jgi:succinate dehydrogenase / fumarate reductase, cytochrome b subunit